MLNCLGNIVGFFGSIPGCCCCPNPFKTVPQGMVGLITRFGKYYKTVDAGYFIMLVSQLGCTMSCHLMRIF